MGKYIRLNNGDILYDPDIESTLENDNISGNVLNLLREGDLVKVEYYLNKYDERVTELFKVFLVSPDLSLVYLGNKHKFLHAHNGEFIESEYEPVIVSVITREKLDSIEFKAEETREIDPAR